MNHTTTLYHVTVYDDMFGQSAPRTIASYTTHKGASDHLQDILSGYDAAYQVELNLFPDDRDELYNAWMDAKSNYYISIMQAKEAYDGPTGSHIVLRKRGVSEFQRG